MKKPYVRFMITFINIILTLTLCWTAIYFVTGYVYRAYDIHIPAFAAQLINFLLGFFLFGCTIYLYTHIITGQRKKQIAYFQSILDAMKQIARGDYNIKLKKMPGHEHMNDPFSELIDQMNEMSKNLGQLEEMRQEFVSNVSHEIQSPLTSISGFARALKNEKVSQQDRIHYLSIIEKETQRLSQLSDNLLKLTYLESPQPLELETYRLDKQLQQAVLACEPQWMEKELQMELHLDETVFRADQALMDQVWLNLLNNAIKFTPVQGKISMHLSAEKNGPKVVIADSGIGIAPEDQLHLFERFYKADKARSRHKGGNGLGLSIVKKIIDLHHGTIEVSSKLGAGTAFTIRWHADQKALS